MVKKKVGGGKRYQAAIKAKNDGAAARQEGAATMQDGPAPPKHMQRKITKKVNFLDRVAASKKAAMAAKAAISKKRKVSRALTDLSSLSGSVNELLQQQLQQQQLLPPGSAARAKAPRAGAKKAGLKRKPAMKQEAVPVKPRKQFGAAVGTSKARALIMAKESARAQQVMQHPLYQVDPIQAISNHLNATLPPAPAPQRQHADGRRAKQGSRKAKTAGAEKKGGGGGSDMED